jgi:HSP20 family molecular chaperone IbpA
MEVLKRKSTLVAALTLIIGVGLGLGIGTWTTRSDAASSSKSEKVELREEARRPSISRSGDWDPFREMERMQEEIDRAIRRATESFRLGPQRESFSRDRDLSYSSSLDVRDREDHFEVRAYLPDAETKDVKVTTEGEQTLRVKVSHRKEQKRDSDDAQSVWRELGQYEQVVTLPEPVNSKDMKVDTRDHELVITIPKAKAS